MAGFSVPCASVGMSYGSQEQDSLSLKLCGNLCTPRMHEHPIGVETPNQQMTLLKILFEMPIVNYDPCLAPALDGSRLFRTCQACHDIVPVSGSRLSQLKHNVDLPFSSATSPIETCYLTETQFCLFYCRSTYEIEDIILG